MKSSFVPCTLAALIAVCAAIPAPSAAADVRLHYLSRYLTQLEYHDHLMTVEVIDDHLALIGSNLDLVLVDLNAFEPDGTRVFLDRIIGLDIYDTLTRDDGYVYINQRMGGVNIAFVDRAQHTLAHVGSIEEPGVYYEKMTMTADRLYVPAHAYGIRIFDITDPASPALIGSLEEGFDDAFAIAVHGDMAYVADGAGGLKIVDVSDPAAPFIVAGENPQNAVGTAEDVIVIDQHVYVASGGAGVAVYDLDDINSRIVHDTPVSAKRVTRVGDHLVAADIGGIEVFDIGPDGTLARVAGESARRRDDADNGDDAITLRLWHGVAAWGDNRIIAANWDSVDVYELVDPAQDDQPDLTVSTTRLRFAPDSGATTVELRNDGSGPLTITDIIPNINTVTVAPTAAVLQPGEQLDMLVQYSGGLPGSGLIRIHSDDPDENPLPIEVFGDTEFLDPGEEAIPFILESWTYDHENEQFDIGSFDFVSHEGRVMFFHIFGLG